MSPYTAPTESDRWSQRDTLATGHGHCSDNRQQATSTAGRILAALHQRGVTRLHGFGFKALGLIAYGHQLTSADSLAWSIGARRIGRPLPGCTRHKNCANCLRYALRWRTTVLAAAHTPRHIQGELFDV